MTDQELRALVRDAVSRHFSGTPSSGQPADRSAARVLREPDPTVPLEPRAAGHRAPDSGHISHAMYLTLVNAGDACVIEPGVTCNHCGYCKCHGH